jgi:hypothetical protein
MKSTTIREMRISALMSAIISLAACSPQTAQNENSGENQATAERSAVATAPPPSARSRSGRAIDSFHLPSDLEMELALSALPPHLREQATIYVLDPAKGFEVARQGTNGFHAL